MSNTRSQLVKKGYYTGFVLPVGDGKVGKSSIARIIDIVNENQFSYAEIINIIPQTKNIEFEFIKTYLKENNSEISIMIQFLVPPGQLILEFDELGRTYEQVMKIYKFYIRRVDVLILTYDITKSTSFKNIDMWLKAAQEYVSDRTQIVIVATHSDMSDHREVSLSQLKRKVDTIKTDILKINPTWKGSTAGLEISNLSGENLVELKQLIAQKIFDLQYL